MGKNSSPSFLLHPYLRLLIVTTCTGHIAYGRYGFGNNYHGKRLTLIKQLFCSALSILFSCGALAQLTPEQKTARDKGIALYQQSAWDSAQPPLRIAAEAGDPKAQYYLGEALRLNSMYTTSEARKWYEAAANQGDLYSMLRLSDKEDLCGVVGICDVKSGEEWRQQALKIARERAEKSNTEAMTVLYMVGEGLGWVEKAAEGGDSYAQNLLAIAYENGAGWFLTPGNREKAIKKWYGASAESGYPKGMSNYANYLHDHNGSTDEITKWLKKAAEGGHIDAVSTYARHMAHLPDRFGYPIDLVKGYGLTYLLSRLQGGGTGAEDAKRILPKIAEKMTSQEIEQGKAFAKEWERTHPPLSYYTPIYGY